MTTPFVGQITMGGWSFAPRGWALCDGQLLSVSQNDALFSLLGTFYGGDGRTTFGLPDMRGRLPMHQGSGAGLTPRQIGQKFGSETATVSSAQLPSHTHSLQGRNAAAATRDPANNMLANSAGPTYVNQAPDGDQKAGAVGAVRATGPTGTAHNNLMPSLCITFVIALVGVYPSRQ